jgi:hypothetical protein
MFIDLSNIESVFAAIQGSEGGWTLKGSWNADTNVPVLTSGIGVPGDAYIVNVAGNTNLDGITDWQIGDYAVFGPTTWSKIDNTESNLSNIVVLPTGISVLAPVNTNSVNYTVAGAATILDIDDTEAFAIGTRLDVIRAAVDDMTVTAGPAVSLNGVLGGSESFSEQFSRATLLKIANPHTWTLNFWSDTFIPNTPDRVLITDSTGEVTTDPSITYDIPSQT